MPGDWPDAEPCCDACAHGKPCAGGACGVEEYNLTRSAGRSAGVPPTDDDLFYADITREEWNDMTPAQRRERINENVPGSSATLRARLTANVNDPPTGTAVGSGSGSSGSGSSGSGSSGSGSSGGDVDLSELSEGRISRETWDRLSARERTELLRRIAQDARLSRAEENRLIARGITGGFDTVRNIIDTIRAVQIEEIRTRGRVDAIRITRGQGAERELLDLDIGGAPPTPIPAPVPARRGGGGGAALGLLGLALALARGG